MIPGIILAAGASSRMGRPKSMLPIGEKDETFLSRIATTLRAANIDDILVVVNRDLPDFSDNLPSGTLPLGFVLNEHPERGQLSSLLTALRVIDHPGVKGMLVTLVDLPLVSAETVKTLLTAHRLTAAPIVRPVYQGRHGHPVIFDVRVFSDLYLASPKFGAKSVIRAYSSEILNVEVNDSSVFTDIDTPEAYRTNIGREFPEIA